MQKLFYIIQPPNKSCKHFLNLRKYNYFHLKNWNHSIIGVSTVTASDGSWLVDNLLKSNPSSLVRFFNCFHDPSYFKHIWITPPWEYTWQSPFHPASE